MSSTSSAAPSAARLPDDLRLVPLTVQDAPRIAPLNDAAHPAVPVTSSDDLAALVGLAALALGIESERGELVGFVFAVAPGAPYDSENFGFFEQRGVDSLYVDRIVIAESQRGRGLGPVLYERVFALAREQGRAEVTCEVNLDPPNPGSLAFHARLGFTAIGSQPTKGGTVTVQLMAAPV